MASEYLKKKCQHIQPETPAQYTRQEKRKTWWYYHKWYVLLGIILIAALIDIGKDVFQIGVVQPDFQIAYVGQRDLPDTAITALQDAIAELAVEDGNDAEAKIQLNQYLLGAEYGYADEIMVMADLQNGDSRIFLLEDPDWFQGKYQALDDEYFQWKDCPALTANEALDQAVFQNLYFAQRKSFPKSDDTKDYGILWSALTNP